MGRGCFHDVDVTVQHNSQNVTVSMYSNINGRLRDESWAVSDVQVFVLEAKSIKIAVVPAIAKPIWADMLTPQYTDVYEDGTLKDGWSSDKVLGKYFLLHWTCTGWLHAMYTFLGGRMFLLQWW